MLSSSKALMYPSIASLMLINAISFVSPWETQPCKLRHSAIQYPSSSRYSNTCLIFYY